MIKRSGSTYIWLCHYSIIATELHKDPSYSWVFHGDASFLRLVKNMISYAKCVSKDSITQVLTGSYSHQVARHGGQATGWHENADRQLFLVELSTVQVSWALFFYRSDGCILWFGCILIISYLCKFSLNKHYFTTIAKYSHCRFMALTVVIV